MIMKMCPVCKNRTLKSWESTCWWCWQILSWHDEEFGTNWCRELILINNFREEYRTCGFDPFEGVPF